MARLQTPQGGRAPDQSEHPPEDDQQLDEWFTQRLESHGIPVRLGRTSLTRIFSLVGFGVALLGLIWAFSVAGGKSATTANSTPTTTPGKATTGPTTGKKTGGGKKNTGGTAIDWRSIPIDVLNGFGGPGAATSQETLLTSQGWQIRSTGNAGSSASKTVVVYTPGNKAKGQVVARRLKLGAPVAIATMPDVDPASVGQVAIVLGPDLLPQ
jgi:hypothetical protein